MKSASKAGSSMSVRINAVAYENGAADEIFCILYTEDLQERKKNHCFSIHFLL